MTLTVGLCLIALPGDGGRSLIDVAQSGWESAARGDESGGRDERLAQITINLTLRDPGGAERLAGAVSDPDSPVYGHFIDQADFTARFAASDRTLRDVARWLGTEGLRVTSTSPSHRWIKVQAPLWRIEHAFRATFNRRASSEPGWRSATPPEVPDRLAASILSLSNVTLLDSSAPLAAPPPAFRRPSTCSAGHGQRKSLDDSRTRDVPTSYLEAAPLAVCGYTARQLRTFYGVDDLVTSGLDGRGRAVAVVGAYYDPHLREDTDRWARAQGEPALRPDQLRIHLPGRFSYGYGDRLNGGACPEAEWHIEQTLDVQAVHGMAPGADIIYVAATSCQLSDLYEGVQQVLDDGLAQMVSLSSSTIAASVTTADVAAGHATFIQAALQGVGLYFSSGDAGDNVLAHGIRSVNYPAADPWVTAVGGTSIGASASGARLFEVGWQTWVSVDRGRWTPSLPGSFDGGSGGGVSRMFDQPWYQKGIVPASVAAFFGGSPGRAVPDVAMLADPNTGYRIGQTQRFPDGTDRYVELRIGGTSLSAPLFAGVIAIAEQQRRGSIGFANPALYRLYRSARYHEFLDIVPATKTLAVVTATYGNDYDDTEGISRQVRTLDVAASTRTTAGYDDVTGLGSPNGEDFVQALEELGTAHR